MKKFSVVAIAIVMLMIFVGCVSIVDDEIVWSSVDDEIVWSGAYDPNATLNEPDILIIRGALDNLLFDNFPVNLTGTGAGNRLYIWLRLSDEDAEETINEMRAFIANVIENHPQLSTMDIDMGVFVIKTTGPVFRVPVDGDHFAHPTQDLPTLHIEEVAAGGLSFFFINPTEIRFDYGERYRLYVREQDYWRLLNGWMFIVEIGYSIEPLSTTQTRNVDFTWFSEEGLTPGEYKFAKDFMYWRAPGDFDEYTAVQRFLIE
ncbi:MAG: hypothetical protein FWB98_07860 [Defluviitaleaceae bacterium]|nr:hypothetical protein [Defluviitaleaceae bacterium]